MQNKLNTNHNDTTDSAENAEFQPDIHVGRDNIHISGRDFTGVVVGGGSINNSRAIANQGNATLTSSDSEPQNAEEFAEAVASLKELIVKARDAGELDKNLADQALAKLSETANLIKKEDRSKGQIIRRLQYVADILDTAVDLFITNGGVAGVVTHALPIVNLLIKLAGRIF